MFHGKRIVVVVPCYRVARHLRQVLVTMPGFVDAIVVVDDGSPDDIGSVVAAAEEPRAVVMRHETNLGLGRAMATGFREALTRHPDIVVKMDGDGQMDPTHLAALLMPIVKGKADFTKGNRLMHRRTIEGMPPIRLLGNLGLSFVTKVASGYWNIFDPTNGYLALRRELVESLDLDRLGRRYFFESSLLIESNLVGAVVKDVAIPSRYAGEISSLSVTGSLLAFPFLLLRGALRRIVLRYFVRDFTPVALFTVVGGLLALFGASLGAFQWIRNYGSGTPTPAGTVLLAVLPLLVGFQLLLQAAVMDITNVPRESPWELTDPDDAGEPERDRNGV